MCQQMGIQRDVGVEGTLQAVDRDRHYYVVQHWGGYVLVRGVVLRTYGNDIFSYFPGFFDL
jgi:hypothetical protein